VGSTRAARRAPVRSTRRVSTAPGDAVPNCRRLFGSVVGSSAPWRPAPRRRALPEHQRIDEAENRRVRAMPRARDRTFRDIQIRPISTRPAKFAAKRTADRQSGRSGPSWDGPRIHIRPFPNPHRPEVLLALVRVMRPTTELKILDGGRAARCIGSDVVELEESTLAAPAVRTDEPALAAVPLPYLTPDRGRYVTRPRG
jgi:hypothetical protein